MEIKTQAKIYKKTKADPMKISVIFLIFILITTLGLYFYNINLENKIKDLNDSIDKKTNSVKNLENDSRIVVSKLYNTNFSSIKRLENYSEIPVYINHLYKIKRMYNVEFKGFKYESGNIQTQIISSSDSIRTNYNKTYNFITKYRQNEKKDFLFDLEQIKNINTTYDNVSNIFNINLKLKNDIDILLQEIEKDRKELLKKRQELREKRESEIRAKLKEVKNKKN